MSTFSDALLQAWVQTHPPTRHMICSNFGVTVTGKARVTPAAAPACALWGRVCPCTILLFSWGCVWACLCTRNKKKVSAWKAQMAQKHLVPYRCPSFLCYRLLKLLNSGLFFEDFLAVIWQLMVLIDRKQGRERQGESHPHVGTVSGRLWSFKNGNSVTVRFSLTSEQAGGLF